MRTLYIIKTGSTFPAIRQQHGDFEQWMQAGLHPKHVLPAERPAMAVIDAAASGLTVIFFCVAPMQASV